MEKILDVNLLEAMSKIARCSRASTTDSFFYDQEAIKKAARQKPEKRCSLLWICFPDGTELYPIADAFKCGSRPYENAQFFQQDERVERVSVFYELEISQKRNGVIRGNIYAVDSRWFAGLAKGPPSSDLTAAKHTPAQWSGLMLRLYSRRRSAQVRRKMIFSSSTMNCGGYPANRLPLWSIIPIFKDIAGLRFALDVKSKNLLSKSAWHRGPLVRTSPTGSRRNRRNDKILDFPEYTYIRFSF